MGSNDEASARDAQHDGRGGWDEAVLAEVEIQFKETSLTEEGMCTCVCISNEGCCGCFVQ